MGEILERKKKCTNKSNDKQEEADSLLQETSHIQRFTKFHMPFLYCFFF